MVDQDMMKVYELAKELGLPPLSLLDRLNELNIKVKSHMSELTPDQVLAARNSLVKGERMRPSSTAAAGATSAKKATATRTRKKPESEAPAGATSAGAPISAPTPVVQAPPPQATIHAGATATAPGKGASTVIRRRVKSDGALETTVTDSAGHITQSTQTAAEAAAAEPRSARGGQDGHPTITESTPDENSSRVRIVRHDRSTAETSTLTITTTHDEAEEMAALPEESMTEEAQSEAPAQATPVPPVRTRPAIVLPPRPTAPRRSILKVVSPTAPTKPTIIQQAPAPIPGRPMPRPGAVAGAAGTAGAAGATDRDGYRPIRLTKENLDQMAEEENQRKKIGGGREPEVRPEDVRFADFRKKEMVFLPKRKKLPLGKEVKRTVITTPAAHKRYVEMEGTIGVQALANGMGVKAIDVVRKLMQMGQMINMNSVLDFDTATLVAGEFQYEVKNVEFKEASFIEATPEDQEGDLNPRPPVVTIMGHVDHGKTSLLDAIREANVAGGEAGGITQHIGAYTVEKDGNKITFIDTPGHEAFTVMRARGANVTDIVILVVAADDGVMPQTREALSHAKAAGVPIIVAMNKIDKPQANPEKIKQQLAELDLLAEDWGGQTMFVPVSAVKRTNLDKLLESILLQAEVLDLKGNEKVRATGTVLEARLERGRGPVVSMLVRRGVLRVGDPVVSGSNCGKVKAMMDHTGRMVKEVPPGMAAEVLGFESVPNAGDRFDSPKTDVDARSIAENRGLKAKAQAAATASGKVSLEDVFSRIQAGAMKELNLILKADVFGSAEAIRDSLVKLSNEKVKVKVIHTAPGGITESDVLLATASKAIILGFNVRPETKARQEAEAQHVEIKCYNIIYELIDEVKKSMVGLLDKKKVEKFVGRAEVRQPFTVPKIGTVAGSAVIDGKMLRGANVRLLRDSRVIWDGKMSSLRRFKDDAKEVATGYECGIGLENYNDIKAGDIIEAYTIEMVTPDMNS